MGNIPLPALDVAPIQQGPDPIKRYQELVAIRAAQQQQQQQAALNPIELQSAQQNQQSGALQLAREKYISGQLGIGGQGSVPGGPNALPQPVNAPAGGQTLPQPAGAPNGGQPIAAGPSPQTQQIPTIDADALIDKWGSNPLLAPYVEPLQKVQKGKDEHVAAVQKLQADADALDSSRNDKLGVAAYSLLGLVKNGVPPQEALAGIQSALSRYNDPWFSQKIQSDFQKVAPEGAAGALKLLQSYVAGSKEAETLQNQADLSKNRQSLESLSRDAASSDPSVSGPAKVALQKMSDYQADVANKTATQRVAAETAPGAVEGQARLAAAKANAETPAMVNRALATQRATQQLLAGPALDQAAQRYLDTGQMPSGMRGPAIATQIMSRASELNPGARIAANSAAYQANKSSYENVTKTLDTLSAFENTGLKNLQNFTNLAQKIPDTGIPWLNTPVRSLNEKMVGSPDQAAAVAAGQVALREIARVTNDPKLSGALTDSARQEVAGLIPAGATLPQVKRVAQVLIQDMSNVHQGLAAQKQDIGSRLGIGGGSPAQQQNSGLHVIQIGAKKYQYKGSGNTADLSNYTELK